MDKYTQLVNKVLSNVQLNEYGHVMSTSDEEKDVERKRRYEEALEIGLRKYKNPEDAEKYAKKKIEAEDGENALSPDNLKTIETVKSLAGGKAKGGLNPFDKPEKDIQKAYGTILKKLAGKINKIKI